MNRPTDLDDHDLEHELRTMLRTKAMTVTGPPPPLPASPSDLVLAPGSSAAGSPDRRRGRLVMVAAVCLVLVVGALALIRLTRGPAAPTKVRAGQEAPPADLPQKIDPDLPPWLDAATARSVFNGDGPIEAVAEDYLLTQTGGGGRFTFSFRTDRHVVADVSRVRWTARRTASCDLCPVRPLAGRIYLRPYFGRVAVVAALADGVSMRDVTFEGRRVLGSVVAPMPLGNQSMVSADVGDLHRGATDGGRAVGGPHPPGEPPIAAGTPVRVGMPRRPPKQRKVLLSVERLSLQDGGGFQLPGGEIRLDRFAVDGRGGETDRLTAFGTDLYLLDSSGRSGTVQTARHQLAQSGFDLPERGLLSGGSGPSIIYFAPARRGQALRVARALGLSDHNVAPLSDAPPGRLRQGSEDVLVILGPDYDQ